MDTGPGDPMAILFTAGPPSEQFMRVLARALRAGSSFDWVVVPIPVTLLDKALYEPGEPLMAMG